MYYTEISVILLTSAYILALPLIMMTLFSIRRRVAKITAQPDIFDQTTVDAIAERIVVKTSTKDAAAFGELNSHMSEIRDDFDWLVSNRMIEQAVEMAKLGEAGDYITKQTGISNLELEAIRKHRRH